MIYIGIGEFGHIAQPYCEDTCHNIVVVVVFCQDGSNIVYHLYLHQ